VKTQLLEQKFTTYRNLSIIWITNNFSFFFFYVDTFNLSHPFWILFLTIQCFLKSMFFFMLEWGQCSYFFICLPFSFHVKNFLIIIIGLNFSFRIFICYYYILLVDKPTFSWSEVTIIFTNCKCNNFMCSLCAFWVLNFSSQKLHPWLGSEFLID